ncbi:MAG: hypothetical protein GY788_21105 [bacterium]|nr:hypothetical protein [bacterium]
MGVTYTNFANDVAMVSADVETEFDRGVDWLNTGIVAGDIDTIAIAAQHVYRPETLGFPTHRTQGVLEQLHERKHGTSLGMDGGNPRFFESPVRTSIFPESLGEGQAAPVDGTQFRLYLRAASEIEINYVWETWPKGDFSDGGANTYPDDAGYFVVAFRPADDASTVKSTIPYTKRLLPVRWAATGAGSGIVMVSRAYNTGFYKQLTAGVWDVWLEYGKGAFTAPGTVDQIITHMRTAVCEIHEA